MHNIKISPNAKLVSHLKFVDGIIMRPILDKPYLPRKLWEYFLKHMDVS